MSTQHLQDVLHRADTIDWDAGLSAYSKYNLMMTQLGARYAVSLDKATAVFVSTSPNNDFIGNLRSTVSILHGWRNGIPEERIRISAYHYTRKRAWAYLAGEKDFLESTRGPKITAFFKNIVDPHDRLPVTVDGHMVSMWSGKRMNMKDAIRSKFNYEEVAQGVRDLARERGLIPNQIQSVLWFTWKSVNQIVFKGTLDLFGDHWGLDINPWNIKPFPVYPRKEV